MANTEMVMGIESASEMLEQLRKAFTELESNRDVSSNYGILWEEMKEHFQNLESSLKKRFKELEEKEKAFEEKMSASQVLVVEREVAVTLKEQASVDRIQGLKDAAVAAIEEARKNFKVASPEPADIVGNKENKVSTSFNSDLNASFLATEEKSSTTADVMLRLQLKQLCEQMDAKGLLNFLYQNRKNLATIRGEIPIALKSATDPAGLVLDSLEGFYPPNQSTSQGNEKTLQVLRRACIVFMESATPLLGLTEPGGDHPLSSETKHRAKAIADEWKAKLADVDIDAANGNSLEAQAFLQLLATFTIASEFDEDVLCMLVLAVSHRRQAPEICRSLGLTNKMPGVIETLINNGKQIDAVKFIKAFQLTESFPPVPLLKTYLTDTMRNAQEENGNAGVAGVQDVNAQELGALRAVIRCIADNNLQAEYPPDSIRKRVAQLEKAKADKKRMSEAARFQAKKARRSGGYAPQIPAFPPDDRQTQPLIFDQKGLQGLQFGGSERYPYTVPASHNYQMPTHTIYGQQANAQSQRSYYYPDESLPSTPYSASSNYGNYMGTGMQSSHQSYM